jgi:preprotein translocase subunit SecB
MTDENQQLPPVFSIEKIYTKDLSLEIPHAPQIFMEQERPAVDIQLHNEGGQIGENLYESTVTITVTAKIKDKTLFLVEVTQGGIFRIENVPEQDLLPALHITCPNIVFPYAREVVSDMTVRAGFPPVHLSPVNFEAVFQERLRQAAAAQNVPAPAAH